MKEHLLQNLSVRRMTLVAAYGVTAAAYVAAIVWVLFDWNVSLWIVNITTLFYIFGVRTLDRRFNRAFAKANLTLGCGQNLLDVQVYDKGLVSRQRLEQQGLLPTKAEGNGVLCGLGMTARQGKACVEVCEVTTYYPLPQPAAKRKVALLDGVWLEVRLARDTGLHLVFAEKNVLDSSVYPSFYEQQNLRKLPMDQPKLRDRYDVFGADDCVEHAGRFVRQCAQLAACAQKNGSGLLVQIRGDRICAFLNRRSLSFTTPIREAITDEIVGWDRLPELALLSAMGEYWCEEAAESASQQVG